MNNYPDTVAKIADDYLARLNAQLQLLPENERGEFVREIQSHVYEAYQQTPGDDDVARILTVLRNLGEPSEVVAENLPGTMVRSGTRRNMPLYILGGIVIALFGLPLGFGGLGVVFGLLAALAGVLVAYYATAGSILLVAALFILLGMMRAIMPGLWDQLVALGYIQVNGPPSAIFDGLSASEQGLIMILFGGTIGAAGIGMLWLGKRMLRGLRFLFTLALDRTRRLAESIRRRYAPPTGKAVRYPIPIGEPRSTH